MLSTIVDLAVEIDVDRFVSAVSVLSTIVDLAVLIADTIEVSAASVTMAFATAASSVLAIIEDWAVDNAVDKEVIDEAIEPKLFTANIGVEVSEDLSIPEGIALYAKSCS